MTELVGTAVYIIFVVGGCAFIRFVVSSARSFFEDCKRDQENGGE